MMFCILVWEEYSLVKVCQALSYRLDARTDINNERKAGCVPHTLVSPQVALPKFSAYSSSSVIRKLSKMVPDLTCG